MLSGCNFLRLSLVFLLMIDTGCKTHLDGIENGSLGVVKKIDTDHLRWMMSPLFVPLNGHVRTGANTQYEGVYWAVSCSWLDERNDFSSIGCVSSGQMKVACGYKSFKTFLRKIHQTAGNLKFKYETSEQKSKKIRKSWIRRRSCIKRKKKKKKNVFWTRDQKRSELDWLAKKNINE